MTYAKLTEIISMNHKLLDSWSAITSRAQIYSSQLPKDSEVFFHFKIEDADRHFEKFAGMEILIFKKKAIFESVLKNMLT